MTGVQTCALPIFGLECFLIFYMSVFCLSNFDGGWPLGHWMREAALSHCFGLQNIRSSKYSAVRL